MPQKGKLENIKKEMKRMKINTLGIIKVRRQGAEEITSRGAEHEREEWLL